MLLFDVNKSNRVKEYSYRWVTIKEILVVLVLWRHSDGVVCVHSFYYIKGPLQINKVILTDQRYPLTKHFPICKVQGLTEWLNEYKINVNHIPCLSQSTHLNLTWTSVGDFGASCWTTLSTTIKPPTEGISFEDWRILSQCILKLFWANPLLCLHLYLLVFPFMRLLTCVLGNPLLI